MAHSGSSGGNPFAGVSISEKLGKGNHVVWKAQVLAVIRGARLEGYLTGAAKAPDAVTVIKKDGKEVEIANPEFEEWVATDQQVLGYLLSTMGRDTLTQVAACRTSAAAWSIVEGLNEDYDQIVSSLVSRVEPVTVGEVYSQLLYFENRVTLRQAEAQMSAHLASRGRGRGSSQNRGRGNFQRGRNSRGRGRNNTQGQRFRNNQGNADNRPKCQLCHKRGHTVIECWHRYDENFVPDEKYAGAAVSSYGVDSNWYMDTGATDHVTGELEKLTVHDRYKGHDQVHTANGEGHEGDTS